MKIFVCFVLPFGAGAKNRGIIRDGPAHKEAKIAGAETFVLHANDRNQAYRQVCELCWPFDSRPIAGKSYLREFRPQVGQRCYIPSWPIGFNDDGSPKTTISATITEIVSDTVVSVHPDGYHNDHVDFTAREVVLR